MNARLFVCLIVFALAESAGFAADAGETVIEIKAQAGLRFDIARFKVAPGAKVRLTLENTDDMAHNLVITAPGARMNVVTAALTMPITPTQDFIPKTDKILFHTSVLTPGKSDTITFTAPSAEGVYPYVCTYPGHGIIMFGAMYVTTKEMPPLASDPNVPPGAKEAVIAKEGKPSLHAYAPKPPYYYRMFVRDSGPASIAVALPGGQNYCWDAGVCRLRYAWRGEFLDPMPHWKGNGDAFAEVKGRIYWRANAGFPLRLGSPDKTPAVKFRGYRLVQRYPEFRYEIDGVEVRELIKPLQPGAGLAATFTIADAKTPVFYVAGEQGGASFGSSTGQFKNGVLELTPEQAKNFTITLTEIPGKEPLAYYSMNDTTWQKGPYPVPGVKGRAVAFDGKKTEFDTGISTNALKSGATIEFWVQLTKPNTKDQVIVGASSGQDRFALGYRLGDAKFAKGFAVVNFSGGQSSLLQPVEVGDEGWHHVAVIVAPQKMALYVDGQSRESAPGAGVMPKGNLFIGSAGGANFFAGLLDEVRIYDRVLDGNEIRAIYERERPKTSTEAAK
jgi:azurin